MNNLFPEDREGLRKLFPELTEEELKEADERIGRYLELALEVYERIRQDPVRYAELQRSLADNGRCGCMGGSRCSDQGQALAGAGRAGLDD